MLTVSPVLAATAVSSPHSIYFVTPADSPSCPSPGLRHCKQSAHTFTRRNSSPKGPQQPAVAVGDAPIVPAAQLLSQASSGVREIATAIPSATARKQSIDEPSSTALLDSPSTAVEHAKIRESSNAVTSKSKLLTGRKFPTPSSRTTSTHNNRRPNPSQPIILPRQYDLCPVKDMVDVIGLMLSELIPKNDALKASTASLTRFHSRSVPRMPVRDYLYRVAQHTKLTTPLLVAIVYYIDLLCSCYPTFAISSLTVHRFLITAATVASKGLSDAFWKITRYAEVGGLPVAELKMLELEFLYRVDWKIIPNPEDLVCYYHGLVDLAPGYTLDGDPL